MTSTAPLAAAPRSPDAAASAGMSLLSKRVPLSLLMDLAFGPHSEELLTLERSEIPGQRSSLI